MLPSRFNRRGLKELESWPLRPSLVLCLRRVIRPS